MGSFIVQQPNGLFCRFSTTTDCPTHWNMTAQKYIMFRLEEARIQAEKDLMVARSGTFHTFNDVIESFIPNNITEEDFQKILKEMGYKPEEK